MTRTPWTQIEAQIPEGETIDRWYRAVEGDIRVITKNARGWEKRYTVDFHEDGTVTIREF